MHNMIAAHLRVVPVVLASASDRLVSAASGGRYFTPSEVDAERRQAFRYGLEQGRRES